MEMYNSRKWLTGFLGMAMCLILAVTVKQDARAGQDYAIGSYIVCTQDTNLLILPDCNAGEVAPITKDSVAVVVENGEIYTKVSFNGAEGYLYQEFIGLDEEVIAAYEAELEAQRLAMEMALKSEEVRMMAAIIQCEAGNQPMEGQIAVGAVIMNRVKSPSYPNSIPEVIYQPSQFGPSDSQMFADLLANDTIKDSCREAAKQAYMGTDNVGGALHFRRAGSKEGLVIGDHVFY